MEEDIVQDGTVVTEPSKMAEVWRIRESIASALLHDGDGCFKYDISLPVHAMYEIVNILRERYTDRTSRIVGYGHFGDGNLHLNVVAPTYDKVLMKVCICIMIWRVPYLRRGLKSLIKITRRLNEV